MITLEQVEKLREYADISYDEARTALEHANGDILQALIDLECQGKVSPPENGGKYVSGSLVPQSQAGQNTDGSRDDQSGYGQTKGEQTGGTSFGTLIHRFLKWCGNIIHRGNANALIVEKHGERIMKLPVTALALLLLFAFWFVIPLFIVGLFFDFRYFFQGPDLGKDKVNQAMDSAAKAAEEFKNDIRGK